MALTMSSTVNYDVVDPIGSAIATQASKAGHFLAKELSPAFEIAHKAIQEIIAPANKKIVQPIPGQETVGYQGKHVVAGSDLSVMDRLKRETQTLEDYGRILLDAINEYVPFSMGRVKRNLGFLDILQKMVHDKLKEFRRTKNHRNNKSKRVERTTNRKINQILKGFFDTDQLEIEDRDELVELDRILQDQIPKVKEALQNGENDLADVDPHATMDPWLPVAVNLGLMSKGIPPFGPYDLVPFNQERYRSKLLTLEEMHLFANEGRGAVAVYGEDLSFNMYELGRLDGLYIDLQSNSDYLLNRYLNDSKINVDGEEGHDQLIQQMVRRAVVRVQDELTIARDAGWPYLLEAAQHALDLYQSMQ